jgi:hypothetical protein
MILANKLLLLAFFLYVIAGISALVRLKFSVFIVLAASIFLAFGACEHAKIKAAYGPGNDRKN